MSSYYYNYSTHQVDEDEDDSLPDCADSQQVDYFESSNSNEMEALKLPPKEEKSKYLAIEHQGKYTILRRGYFQEIKAVKWLEAILGNHFCIQNDTINRQTNQSNENTGTKSKSSSSSKVSSAKSAQSQQKDRDKSISEVLSFAIDGTVALNACLNEDKTPRRMMKFSEIYQKYIFPIVTAAQVSSQERLNPSTSSSNDTRNSEIDLVQILNLPDSSTIQDNIDFSPKLIIEVSADKSEKKSQSSHNITKYKILSSDQVQQDNKSQSSASSKKSADSEQRQQNQTAQAQAQAQVLPGGMKDDWAMVVEETVNNNQQNTGGQKQQITRQVEDMKQNQFEQAQASPAQDIQKFLNMLKKEKIFTEEQLGNNQQLGVVLLSFYADFLEDNKNLQRKYKNQQQGLIEQQKAIHEKDYTFSIDYTTSGGRFVNKIRVVYLCVDLVLKKDEEKTYLQWQTNAERELLQTIIDQQTRYEEQNKAMQDLEKKNKQNTEYILELRQSNIEKTQKIEELERQIQYIIQQMHTQRPEIQQLNNQGNSQTQNQANQTQQNSQSNQ